MSKLLSVLIPSRNEQFLPNTVADLLKHATGDIEIIPVLDGYWPTPSLPDDKRLHTIHFGQSRGMRAAINAGAVIAKGEYLMKCDAHCSFGEGFDEILKADCDGDWVVIPRRDRLDAERWCRQESNKPPVDYEFLSYPFWKPEEPGLHGTQWNERTLARMNDPRYEIDDDMGFQGSCWFTTAEHFHKRIGGMSEYGYFSFIGEPQELGNKTWLGGGRVVVNKRTHYLHLHKGSKYGRGYFIDKREMIRGNLYSVAFWTNDAWKERKHDLAWLVEKFWPVPTWPNDWREQLERRKRELLCYL